MMGFVCSLLACCEIQGKKPMLISLPADMFFRLASELRKQQPESPEKPWLTGMSLTFQGVHIACDSEVLLIEFEPRSYV